MFNSFCVFAKLNPTKKTNFKEYLLDLVKCWLAPKEVSTDQCVASTFGMQSPASVVSESSTLSRLSTSIAVIGSGHLTIDPKAVKSNDLCDERVPLIKDVGIQFTCAYFVMFHYTWENVLKPTIPKKNIEDI